MLLVSCAVTPAKEHSAEWSYSGDSAPYHWGEVKSDFKACAEGKFQSPVNLQRMKSTVLKHPIHFSYSDISGSVHNNGHALVVSFDDKAYVELEGIRFYLRQLHFHVKSEHALEGLFYPAELHVVHEDQNRQLLVLGFLLEINDEDFDRYGFFAALPEVGETVHGAKIALEKLVRINGGHFYYRGSLTTPPCTEGVRWVIFDKHIRLSSEQLSRLEALYPNNYRPLRPLNGRPLYHAE